MTAAFFDKLRRASEANDSLLCVGLDPDPDLMPVADVVSFCQAIIRATSDLVCAYKPNLPFFEALGPNGMNVLIESLQAVPEQIPVIVDAKRGDIGNTARFYARTLFKVYGFEATTVNVYGGGDAVEPFLEYADKGIFVWCRSSNPGAADLQDLPIAPDNEPLYLKVAELASRWNKHGNIGLVLGATYPKQISTVRSLCPDMMFLLPGVGAQSGDLKAAVCSAAGVNGGGFIINASRQVIYAGKGSDYAQDSRRAAQELRDEINRVRSAPSKRE